MKRLFVAINPPKSIQQGLIDLNPHIDGVYWTGGDQMHLTLGFFGDVPELAEVNLREKLSAIEFRAFFLPIAGIGTFPAKGSPKILWIGVGAGHPHLFQLHKRVQEAALGVGLEPDLRPWHPHITLARCRDVTGGTLQKFLKSKADLDAGMFRVDAFHLYCSDLTPAGPIHTCQLSIPSRSDL
jgi:2'-5' RNA ligase